MNLADSIRSHALVRPSHVAIVFGDRTIDYGHFDRLVDAAAALLKARGVGEGKHVGIALSDRPEHLAFLYAVARIDAVFVPVDCRWTNAEKERICVNFHVQLLLLNPGDQWNGAVPSMEIPEIWEPAEFAMQSSTLGAVCHPDRPLAIYLSSGTTGMPKGPILTHENLAARFGIYRNSLEWTERERFASVSPLYFSASRGFAMCILHLGATLVLLPPPLPPARMVDAIRRTASTSASLVPTLIRRILEERTTDGPCMPELRSLISTGAVLNAQERAQAMRRITANLFTFYGSSEGGGVSVLRPDHPPEKSASAGAVLPGTLVRIVDENLRDVALGVVGRICYRSAATASGTYGEPSGSMQNFYEGWFLPGDLGCIDADGFIWITGREKDMIIRGGANIYPEEIEQVLRTHACVTDAAVVGVPSEEYGEEAVAFVALRADADDRELLDWCRKELAPYKLPLEFRRLAELPKTAVGKTDKLALKSRAAEPVGDPTLP